jgi:hypothetical protein
MDQMTFIPTTAKQIEHENFPKFNGDTALPGVSRWRLTSCKIILQTWPEVTILTHCAFVPLRQTMALQLHTSFMTSDTLKIRQDEKHANISRGKLHSTI